MDGHTVVLPSAAPETVPVFGVSAGVPTATNTPSELDQYRGLSKFEFLDYLQAEFSQLSQIPYSASDPIFGGFHNYDAGIPTSFASSVMAGVETRGMTAVHNMKADNVQLAQGAFDSDIASYCASIPEGQKVWAIINHEPENDTGYNPVEWKAGVAAFCKAVQDNKGTKDVTPGVCAINWSLHPNNNGFNPEDMNPATEMLALGVNLNEVIYTTDGYDTEPISIGGATNLFDATSDLARSWGFPRFGVSETGCKSYNSGDRALAAAWMREMADLAYAKNMDYVMWFNSGVGNRAGPEGWWIYDDLNSGYENKRQWAEICAGVYIP